MTKLKKNNLKKAATAKSDNISTRPTEYTTNRNWNLISDQLKQWSLKEDSQILEEFYTNLDIPHDTFYRNIATNETLKEAHKFALTRLGINREKHCNKNNLSMNSVMANSLPDYLDRWKKNVEWRQKMKNEDDNQDKKYILVDRILATNENRNENPSK